MRWRELPREASWPCWWSWLGWQVGTTGLGGMSWGIFLGWAEGTWRRPQGSVAGRRFFVELFPLGPLPPSTSSCLCPCVLSCVQVFVTPRTVARQAPLSMEFSRQEYWRGCHALRQGIFLTQGLNPVPCIAGRFFTIQWSPLPAMSTLLQKGPSCACEPTSPPHRGPRLGSLAVVPSQSHCSC